MTHPTADFVGFLRSSAPYIHAHRGRTFVVVFGGEAMASKGIRALVHDVALLMSLGVRVVLVAGARPQIDARLALRGIEPRYEGGVRVTDADAMACAKEASGTNRVELEALFSTALPNSPMEGSRVRVATGNYLTAKPYGVISGVDYQYTGRVRRVDHEAIRRHLDAGQLVLLTPIGYSATGEAFNLATPEVASAAATALSADKLICLVEGRGLVSKGGVIKGELGLADAEQLLAKPNKSVAAIARDLSAAVDAVRGGVRRAHIVPRRIEGGLLRELYTRDGAGTLVSAERFEGMREARIGDVPSILALIEPLAEAGQLVRRPKEMLEEHVDRFTVVERDGMIVACVAVYLYRPQRTAEIACVAVHPSYRSTGRAAALVEYAERRAREDGMKSVFVLTTQAEHFFRELGYEPSSEKKLPSGKTIDPRRLSKVFVKAV